MIMVILLIADIQIYWVQILTIIVTYVAVILTVISLIDYIVKNKNVLKDTK